MPVSTLQGLLRKSLVSLWASILQRKCLVITTAKISTMFMFYV